MKFVLGVVCGAAGLWAYRSGKLREWLGVAPEPVRQTMNRAAQQVNNIATSEPVREFASRIEGPHRTQASSIVTPSAAEVAGRPADPLPS
jgi:hypothetical protein